MPDDLQIPITSSPQSSSRPSYRMDRPERGLDPGTRQLLMYAGVALAVLMLAIGTWAFIGRRPASIPVIEADTRPLRVKPDNPGGMQIAGADESEDAAPTLAPAPEAPAPLALRAQVQANRPVPAPASAPALAQGPAAGPIPATTPATTLAAVPLADPAPPASSQQAANAARPAAPPARPSAGGGAQVQLGALETEDAARTEWARLQKKFPELLGGRQLSIQRADRDGKPIYRVRTGGFQDLADATGFCAKVRAKGGGCSLGTF